MGNDGDGFGKGEILEGGEIEVGVGGQGSVCIDEVEKRICLSTRERPGCQEGRMK